MNQILNAQRLIQLSQFHPKLKNIWYLVAAATFSVCNEPQEIPKLYHYAMLLSNDNAHMYRFTLASQTIDLLRSELPMRKTLINENYQQPTFFQKQLTAKFREVILKTGPLAGLPRAINGLTMLKETTPDILVPHLDPIDPWEAAMGNSSPLSETSMRRKHDKTIQERDHTIQNGLRHWNSIYNKVSTRVVNNLNSSYPDLWYYTLVHVYGPLFAFDEILSAQETSLMIIASLVPQDVNPQLRGHLKGALNIGCDKETVEAVRGLAILISQWCGVSWKSGVVKL